MSLVIKIIICTVLCGNLEYFIGTSNYDFFRIVNRSLFVP